MEPYELIRQAIIHGDYEPGQRLTEEGLAAEFDVSRTPIREAIRRLEADGLVTSLKRGVSVKSFASSEVQQIYDLRALLESYAAGQAALHRTELDVLELERAHHEYEQFIQQTSGSHAGAYVKAIVDLNNRFHEVVMRACGNSYVGFLISKVAVLPLIFRSFYWRTEAELIRSVEDHRVLLDAIRNQDILRAHSSMAEHILRGRDYTLAHLRHPKGPA